MDEHMLSMNANQSLLAPKIVKAKELLRSQKMNEAREILEQVIEVDPKHADANYILGQLYEFAQEHQKAAQCYSHLIEKNPSDEMKFKLVQAFQNVDEYEKAYLLMKEIYEKKSYDVGICEEFAHIAMVLNKNIDAVEAFNKILEVDKDHEAALMKLAEIYYDEGDKLNHYLIKAKLNYLENMLSGAIDCFKRALNYAKDEDDLVNVLLNLGKVLTDKGNINEAIEQYQFVLATQPDNEFAQKKLTELNEKLSESYEEYNESWIDRLLNFFK